MTVAPELKSKIKEILKPFRGIGPLAIAEKLNISVYMISPETPDFAGAIKKDGDDGISILVNEQDTPARKIFTVAHELGHFFLHTQRLHEGIVSYRDASLYTVYSPEERMREEEANEFAAELLMPEAIFRKFYQRQRGCTLDEIYRRGSDLFGVSKDAVRVRMSYLGLLLE